MGESFRFEPFIRALLLTSHAEDTVQSLETYIDRAIEVSYNLGVEHGRAHTTEESTHA